MTDIPQIPVDEKLVRVLIDSAAIEHRVVQLADRISSDYADKSPLLVVGILKGAFVFMADLCRRLTIPHHVDFIALSSYGMEGSESGAVRMVMDLKIDVKGRHMLVVEDISDTGYTLDYLMRNFAARQPASLCCCSLLSKPELRKVDIKIDYTGFEIPDIWVVGYGLDYQETYRTLPYIAEYRIEEMGSGE